MGTVLVSCEADEHRDQRPVLLVFNPDRAIRPFACAKLRLQYCAGHRLCMEYSCGAVGQLSSHEVSGLAPWAVLVEEERGHDALALI